MKRYCSLKCLTFFFIIVLLVLNHPTASASSAGAYGALQGLGEGLKTYGEELSRTERQKALMQYQYELEAQQQRLAEEARKQEIEKEQEAKKVAEEEEKRNATYTGTGFFVNPAGYLITNAHVIEDRTHIAIRDSKGKFYRVSVVAQDKQNDFALLHVDGSFQSLRIVDSDQVQKGQHVFTVGYPHISIQGNESKVTDGIINSFSGLNNKDNWFQISVPIQGGNSGGPLVNENGEVIGVIVASLDDQKFYSKTGRMPQSVNYAIKSKVLTQFLSVQQISTPPQTKNKTSIDSVDHATVLVIAKNTPLGVTYEEVPIDQKTEDAHLTQLHPDWKALIQSHDFKKWLEDTPAIKESLTAQRANDRAKVLNAYKQYQKEREALEQLTRRNDAVARTYPDWPVLKKNPDFLEWIAAQPESTKNMLESLHAADIINVVRLYKEQPVKKLIEIGRVESIFQQYNYIVFALNDHGIQNVKYVVFLSEGKKIKGSIEKNDGVNVSVTLNHDDMKRVKNQDAVYVVQ